MSKYINADELNKAVEQCADEPFTKDTVYALTDLVPSEDIVHCEECEFWGVYDEPIKHCRKGMLRLPVYGWEYCCKGKRKEQL